jgi:urease beta subunit
MPKVRIGHAGSRQDVAGRGVGIVRLDPGDGHTASIVALEGERDAMELRRKARG